MGPKMSVNFGRYSREFVITVIVITEFDCSSLISNKSASNETRACVWHLDLKILNNKKNLENCIDIAGSKNVIQKSKGFTMCDIGK